MSSIAVGLVGMGTVGGGVVKILANKLAYIQNELKIPLRLKRIADLNTDLFAGISVPDVICSENADDVLNDEEIAIVIELVGGTGFAKNLVLKALDKGKHVITANKALVAEYGPELFSAAVKNNVSIFYEAAVGGGMPSIKTIRESMVGNTVLSISCIINGTCNYILTKMTEDGLSFDSVLKDAQEKGFAEADPTLDIGGGDTGHKVAIMASLISGGYVPYENISIEGITEISQDDILYAEELGYVIKLLGVIKQEPGEALDVRVHPAMLKQGHILSSVSNEFNAVLLNGDSVGDILLYGKGAGELPTASAVVSDIIDCARDCLAGISERIPAAFYTEENKRVLKDTDAITGRYYLRFSVVDKPGVLAAICTSFGEHDISVASVMQREGVDSEFVPLIFITHTVVEKNLRNAIAELEKKDFIKDKTQVIRIEE